MEWNSHDYGISKLVKDTFILPSKIDQMKASQQTESEDNLGLDVHWCLPTLEWILRKI